MKRTIENVKAFGLARSVVTGFFLLVGFYLFFYAIVTAFSNLWLQLEGFGSQADTAWKIIVPKSIAGFFSIIIGCVLLHKKKRLTLEEKLMAGTLEQVSSVALVLFLFSFLAPAISFAQQRSADTHDKALLVIKEIHDLFAIHPEYGKYHLGHVSKETRVFINKKSALLFNEQELKNFNHNKRLKVRAKTMELSFVSRVPQEYLETTFVDFYLKLYKQKRQIADLGHEQIKINY